MAQILLHGTIHATIYEVDKLHAGFGQKFFHKIKQDVQKVVGFDKTASHLYATIDLEKARVGRTRLLQDEHSNPRWYENFHIYCAHMASDVIFTIKEGNPIGAELIGRAYLPVKELLGGNVVDRWLDIVDKNRKPIHGHSKIHVKLQFFDVTRECTWSRGITSPKHPGVPYTFFTQRLGCKVTLYQDAHIPNNFIPKIPLSGGRYYEPHRCWEDIFDAISDAKHLIYITGWSVYTEITLIRDSRRPKHGGDITLGELLIKKANEGVRVLMLVWDDRTSVKTLKQDGLMATHDEETGNYFQNTEVNCILCPRNPDDGRSIIQDFAISTMFTHHQKVVVVDSKMPNGDGRRRRIVSFIGGIDLCDGRYDTPFHSIFRTLDTAHHNDFHQPNFEGASIKKGGPREPWHDIHCKLEGPIAWDVLYNFEQRWRKQGGREILVQLRELENVIIPPSAVMLPHDNETWHVQLFRSIDGGAAFGFPDAPEAAARAGLISGKDSIIDRSIQDGYIHAIRRAKNFIYIENQYFLGSSFSWYSKDIKDEDIGALHLIPKELSLKIVSKIEKGERFTVYVVMPMWPEGIPESPSVQAILDWQKRTMEMMYTNIVQGLRAKGLQANPKDYLTFFCLGNREIKKDGEYLPSEKPGINTDYSRAQQARRFMIYVHAKMMIVDDEYIIIGSANINQRSMDGGRDSEIAICKAVAKSEASCSDHNVCPKLEDNIKGYLNNDLLNKSYEDNSNETMKLISNELTRQSEFLSDNTLTFIEEKVVMRKPEEPKIASVSSQEEASACVMLSPESPSGVHRQEITFREDQFSNCKQSGEKSDSLIEHAFMDNCGITTQRYQIQSSHDVYKGLSVLNCEYSGDEVAEKSSSPSTAPDCNKDYADDMGLVPDPKVNDKLSAQRTMRNTRKRRLWDMAYEGDDDWHFLMHNENVIVDNQDEDENLVKRREKSKLSTMFSEAKDGRNAAVSSGLKARAASPLEKIKFKELLKRKGGLQMYLECRNHILGCWNKDVRRILPLSGCGVSVTPIVNESPDVSLVREIYAFLDHYAYINVGIACEKRVSASHPKYGLQVSSKENLEGKYGASVADLDDGVSFITGKCRNPDASLEEKNVVLPDSESVLAMDIGDKTLLDVHALKSLTPTEPYTYDNHGQRKIDERESIKVVNLDNSKSEPSKEICHVLSKEIFNQGVNPHVPNNSEVGKHIIVIGAGPAGLAAARHLQRQGLEVTVLEARGRIGGRVFTDRESLSVPVDLGASIITGVEADVATERRPDPSSLVCSQLGLELTVLNSDCPLYDTVTGDKVPADLDEDLESEFNSLLDDMELLVAQKGEDAMKMSLEEGLEFALHRRRLVQQKEKGGTSDVHRLVDVDDEVLEDKNSKREILSPLERRVMDWHFAHLEYGCAASLKDVSLPYWNQDDIYGGFGGAHCMIKGGYSTVVEALGEGISIHLNNVVTSITYRCKDVIENKDQHDKVKVSTSTDTDFFGDAVLITVPLGCLKKESIKFSPPLPHWKQLSIQRLGFGVLNKVILEFPEVFWDDNVDYFGATAEETNKRGHCFMFWNVKKTVGAPVLIALLVGKAAVDGHDRRSSDHVNHALVVLRNLFGVAVVPDPVASVVTDWGRDPYSYGAYSYVAIGSSGEDYDILGSPVENCLFFAGEATCKEHPDTVGGAMMSGLREAVRIMNILTTGIDCTAEVNAMEAAQRCVENERSEVGDIVKRLEALQMSNTLYEKSLDGSHVITRKALLQDMFSKAKTTSGRLHLVKELLNFPARVLKSFAGTKEGLSVLNSWILDSLGKDGTQLLRHCVRLLTLVSTDLLAVRVSGIGKTIKEKVCLHTSRDIRAVASQLVNVWIEVFRKQKSSSGGLKLLRHSSGMESSKGKYNLGSGKPPLRTPHGVTKMENRAEHKSKVKVLNSEGSTGRQDSRMEEEKDYIPSEEEQAIIAAEEAARAAAIAAAKAYASSGTKCNTMQLPKIPSFNKYARGEHYSQVDESDIRTLEVDTRNCKVREWTADFSAAHINLESSKRSVDNLSQRSQRSYSNDVPSHLNLREHSADSATVDSTIFTKAWVDSAGSEGIKDGSAIDRWQSQAAAADSEFYTRTMRIIDEEDSNVNLNPPMKNHDGYVNERSALQTSKELVKNQPKGPEKIKQAVVDYVASLLMPLYKDKKFDKDGYKSIMKKTAHKVMEQATYAEKSMAVSEFLDYKRKNKIRAFVDMLIGRHMAAKPGVRS